MLNVELIEQNRSMVRPIIIPYFAMAKIIPRSLFSQPNMMKFMTASTALPSSVKLMDTASRMSVNEITMRTFRSVSKNPDRYVDSSGENLKASHTLINKDTIDIT